MAEKKTGRGGNEIDIYNRDLSTRGLSSICDGLPIDYLVFDALGSFFMNSGFAGRVCDSWKRERFRDDLAAEND